jgi:hypothetical protein
MFTPKRVILKVFVLLVDNIICNNLSPHLHFVSFPTHHIKDKQIKSIA